MSDQSGSKPVVHRIDYAGPDPSKCRHFNGTVNSCCAAGIAYESVKVPHDPIRYQSVRPNGRVMPSVYTMTASIPCGQKWNLSGLATCPKYSPFTADELAEKEAKRQRQYELMKQGLSDCCEAPIDESQVIREGRHKGHGPRFCSKCGRCVLIV